MASVGKMASIFKDVKREDGKVLYERPILVETSPRLCVLTLQDITGIFPALHYFESHPDTRQLNLKLNHAEKIVPEEGDKVEEFAPELHYDSKKHAYGYKNYNFILLNDQVRHPMSRVIKEFSDFLAEIKNPKKRKVKIKDMPPGLYKSVRRVAQAKEQYGRGEFYCKDSGLQVDGVPAAVYIYAERFSSGLRNRMGLMGKMKESNLEERLMIK